ncbi:WD40 repeat-like protein [Guyanagaster necrorhizus]|uniref:WD40 repeat-like protein n=1 Tax=Guyanagaster necrorhizus TaxID=856835 RepID=A0A9P8AYZ0_9AGAR|nr:WD40 repeat-like protein [Guyanagaster necrorhizus MCA 3950]KAG7453153.1 WD40 repeat-like protein [Guyanagaster necrorhizus MCA 3950]
MPESTATKSSVILPIATIQPTFSEVIGDVHSGIIPSEDIWISCYKKASPSVHGKVSVVLDDIDRDLVQFHTKEGNIRVELAGGGRKYKISCPELGVSPTKALLPTHSYTTLPHRITAFALSPNRSQFACGFLDGSAQLFRASPAHNTPTAFYRSHKSTLTSLQFFPSSRVLLSASSDFSVQILPADSDAITSSPDPARTLRAHTRRVTATAIIGPGRSILSAALDGTLRLWDVPSGTQTSMFPTASGINKITPSYLALDSSEPIYAALQDGSFSSIDLRASPGSSSISRSSSSASSLLSIAVSNTQLATGSSRGMVCIYDIRSLVQGPVVQFARNEAAVEDLAFLSPTDVVMGAEDGLPYVASLQGDAVRVEAEIVGTDCDAVRHIRVTDTGDIWTAADDGVVRSYTPW